MRCFLVSLDVLRETCEQVLGEQTLCSCERKKAWAWMLKKHRIVILSESVLLPLSLCKQIRQATLIAKRLWVEIKNPKKSSSSNVDTAITVQATKTTVSAPAPLGTPNKTQSILYRRKKKSLNDRSKKNNFGITENAKNNNWCC